MRLGGIRRVFGGGGRRKVRDGARGEKDFVVFAPAPRAPREVGLDAGAQARPEFAVNVRREQGAAVARATAAEDSPDPAELHRQSFPFNPSSFRASSFRARFSHVPTVPVEQPIRSAICS